jgi:hypothetical protein
MQVSVPAAHSRNAVWNPLIQGSNDGRIVPCGPGYTKALMIKIAPSAITKANNPAIKIAMMLWEAACIIVQPKRWEV